MASNYQKSLYKDYEELLTKYENQGQMLKEANKLVSTLTTTVENLTNTISDLEATIEDLKNEILKLKAQNDKDSSNSSKPSSTNGFKKVITNRREKSNKKQGGQLKHAPHSLNNKLDQFLESGNVIEEIVEVNKNRKNKNKRYIEKVVIDLVVTKKATRYRYYPDKFGKYNIPKYHNQNVQYGSTVKAMCIDLMNNLYNSTDGTSRFIEDITNGGMTISKGTLVLWSQDMMNKLQPLIENIEKCLLLAYYLNHDESQIKIAGDGYNILCACNKKYTRLWISEHKSQEAIKAIGFLPKYKGIIVKDGTELYNPFGCFLAQCLSHILRYHVDFYTKIPHKAPKKMSDFLSRCNDIRNQKIAQDIMNFTDDEYNELMSEYDSILDEWEKELREDVNNYLFNDELALWTRLKYDNKKMNPSIRGDRDEILYFLKDFLIPATNNQAEVDQRNVKIKQKIGKFRSVSGAECYATIRSCINTYKKNDINVFDALISAFNNQLVIV